MVPSNLGVLIRQKEAAVLFFTLTVKGFRNLNRHPTQEASRDDSILLSLHLTTSALINRVGYDQNTSHMNSQAVRRNIYVLFKSD